MEAIETYEKNGYEISIYPDHDSESPRDWDNLGTLVSFHTRYTLGDKTDFKTPDEVRDFLSKEKCFCLPVYLYDHSGLRMNTTGFYCDWDSGQIGWIYVERKKARKELGISRITQKQRERIFKLLRGEIETMDQYLRGDVYGYVVKNKATGEEVDSCWGFYGEEYAKQEAEAIAA